MLIINTISRDLNFLDKLKFIKYYINYGIIRIITRKMFTKINPDYLTSSIADNLRMASPRASKKVELKINIILKNLLFDKNPIYNNMTLAGYLAIDNYLNKF